MNQILEQQLYTSCFDLPLYNFIQISLRGEPEKWNVSDDGWEIILSEYSDLAGDKNMTHVFNLTRQITYLTDRLNIIQLIIDELSIRRVEGLIDLLRKDLGFQLKFEDLQSDLAKVASRSKSDLIKLKLAQSQYDELQKKGGESATEADWNDELAVLGKFQGYAVRQKETTVSEYLAVKKQFRQYVENQNKPR